MKTLTNKATLEIAELTARAAQLAHGSVADRAEGVALVQYAAAIRQNGQSSDENRFQYATALLESLTPARLSEQRYQKALRNYMVGKGDTELRDLLAGQQTTSYTQPVGGGYLVDILFRDQVFEGLKQTSPLFDDSVVTLIREPSFAMPPKQVSGWDLTQIISLAVGEGQYVAPFATPTVSGATLNGWTHRVSLAQSLESAEDILDSGAKTARAASVGFARGIGAAITNGNGSPVTGKALNSQPLGVAYSAPSSGVTLGSGAYSQAQGYVDQIEVENLFYSINRIHRASSKCVFMMSDQSYQKIRSTLYDSSRRPLIDIENGTETLLGKRILITPDLPSPVGSPSVYGSILFGDFSHFIVRLSAISVQLTYETGNSPGNITLGEMLWNFRLRADSYTFDPSNGSTPPIVSALVHP